MLEADPGWRTEPCTGQAPASHAATSCESIRVLNKHTVNSKRVTGMEGLSKMSRRKAQAQRFRALSSQQRSPKTQMQSMHDFTRRRTSRFIGLAPCITRAVRSPPMFEQFTWLDKL